MVYANAIVRKETDASGDEVERETPFLKGYTVFNVEQIEGLPAHYYEMAESPRDNIARDAHADAFFAATGASINHGGNRASYRPATDTIQMPRIETFRDADSFYATLAHEVTHNAVTRIMPHAFEKVRLAA